MAQQTNNKRPSTPMDKLITAIIVVVVLAVLGLAVYATYSKISANVAANKIEEENQAIQEGTQEANVRYLAEQAGKSVDEYLGDYGLALGDNVTEKTTQSELMQNMTVENYLKYTDEMNGTAEGEDATDVEQALTDWSAADFGITKDTVWSEVETKLPIMNYLGGEEQYNSLVDTYKNQGYDLSPITKDMPLKDAQDKISEIISAAPTLPTPEPTAAPETEEAPAE